MFEWSRASRLCRQFDYAQMRIRLHWSIGILLVAMPLSATQFLFSTPTGAVNPNGGSPVAVTALFTVSNGQLQITVTNTEADPTSVSQALAEMTFQLSVPLTSPSMTSSAEQATVYSGGYFSTTSAKTTGWTLTNGSTLTLCDACTSTPKQTLIGPPNTSTDKYTSAGSTIRNSSNDPFLWETAGFTITSGALTADVKVIDVTFYFGTTAGQGAVNGIESVPEPSTKGLLAGGALLLALAGCRRKPIR